MKNFGKKLLKTSFSLKNHILKVTIIKITDNKEHKMPPTVDDTTILTEIKEYLTNNKILKND